MRLPSGPARMTSTRIYTKTELGSQALASSRDALSTPARQLLILIDGQRNHGELAAIFGNDIVDKMLPFLQAQGFVQLRHAGTGAAPPTLTPARPTTAAPATIQRSAAGPRPRAAAPPPTLRAGAAGPVASSPGSNTLAVALLAAAVLLACAGLWWFMASLRPAEVLPPDAGTAAPLASTDTPPAADALTPAPPVALDTPPTTRASAAPARATAAPVATKKLLTPPPALAHPAAEIHAPAPTRSAPATAAVPSTASVQTPIPASASPAASATPVAIDPTMPASTVAAIPAAAQAPRRLPEARPESLVEPPTPTPTPPAGVAKAPSSRAPVLKTRERFMPEIARRAQRNDITSGVLVVRLQVQPDGTVAAVDVVRADPPLIYDTDVERTLRRWTFEPPGQAAQVTVRFDFKP